MGELSEQELSGWLKPADALALLPESLSLDSKARVTLARLSSGFVRVAAKSMAFRSSQTPQITRDSYCLVQPHLWVSPWNVNARDLWALGDLHFDNDEPAPLVYVVGFDDPIEPDRTIMTVHYAGVRIDPASFCEAFDLPIGNPSAPVLTDAPGVIGDSLAPKLPALKEDDAKRFSRAILSEWPDSTQDFAFEKAALFFNENSVPRDWFRSVFRSIRGPVSRGKKAKDRN